MNSVTITDEDFKKASQGKSDSIEIKEFKEFVKAEEINPRYFEKPYLLEPEKGAGKTYNLLRRAPRLKAGWTVKVRQA